MKVSVVTINRNDAAGLARTLASTLGACGDVGGWEQIVVDGASTDGSMDALVPYRGNPRLASAVSEPDAGRYDAMNKGAARARGDFLLFLNAGDELVPGALEEFLRADPAADLAYGDLLVRWPDGSVRRKESPDPERVDAAWFLAESLPHPATFVSAALFRRLGGYDTSFRIVSDAKFFLDAVRGGARLFRLPFPVSVFDRSGISTDPAFAALHRRERRAFLEPVFGAKLARLVTSPGVRSAHGFPRPAQLDAAREDPDLARCLLRANDLLSAAWRFRAGRAILRGIARAAEARERRRTRPGSAEDGRT